MPQSRQLAAIMFTDIVGYTASMGEDEQKAFDLLRKNRQIQQPIIKQFNGTWIKELGDGVLASFHTATDAVICAGKIQKACALVPGLRLRIGIHLGDVVFENHDVFGDSVNIASRIQALAPIGGIWVSESVYKNIANKKGINSRYIAEETLKNVREGVKIYEVQIDDNEIEQFDQFHTRGDTSQSAKIANRERKNHGLNAPKRQEMHDKLKVDAAKRKNASRRKWIVISTGAMLIIIAVFIYNPFTSRTAFTGKEKSIAVLPFVNIGNDPNQEYFSDGITEEIITQLSKIADLKVISRSTAMLYKNSKKPVKQIAAEMSVASILEGSVRKSGDEIRITAQLIDANTQEHIWAERYDHRSLNDIFSIQNEVAQQIARELHARLSKEEKIKIEKKPTDNPEAYDLFLKGRYALNTYTLEGFHNAEVLFQEAVKKDPNFKLAYSYLANVYVLLISMMGDLPPSAGVQKAMSILNKSLQKDTLYIDFETLSYIELWANKNYPKAEYYMGRVISLSPNEPTAYLNYAMLLTMLARTEEASVQIHKAKMLDPVNTFVLAALAENFYSSGQYEEAIRTFKEAIQVFPSAQMLYDELGRVYVAKQNYPDAINILTEGLTRSSFRLPSTLAFLAVAYFETGNTKISSELIQELKQRANSGEKGINIFIALYYSAINHKEESFNYLDQALNTNDVDLILLKQEPSFTNLRGDPRFGMYLKRAGF